MSTTYTPESLAAEMEQCANSGLSMCGLCEALRRYADAVRALAAPVQPVATEPEAATDSPSRPARTLAEVAAHIKRIYHAWGLPPGTELCLIADEVALLGRRPAAESANPVGEDTSWGAAMEGAAFGTTTRPVAESDGAGDATELREALRVIRDYADAARDEWSPTAAKEILIAANRLAAALGLDAPEAEVTP